MFKTGIGRSNNFDSAKAGDEACRAALAQAGGNANLITVFSSVFYDQEKMLQAVQSVAKNIPVVGCSSFGEITTEGPSSKNVAVAALNSPDIKYAVGIGKGTDKDSFKAAKEAAIEVKDKARDKISLFIMFLDGLAENGAAAVRGVQDVFGKNFPIMGGSAGDDFLFKKTYEYYNGEVLTNAVVGVGLSGKFSFGVGVKHGWEPIGLPMKVTKAKGGKLIEVDNRPAISIYEDYFGKKAEELTKEPIAKMAYTYPLGMSVKGSPELLIRDVVIANEKGEIICAAEIPEDSEIRLMLGDREKAIQSAKEASENALAQLKGVSPKAIFVFDCVARHKLLGDRIGEEITAIQNVLGKDVPLIGFYTYGEQAPLGGALGPECFSVFHNETMTLMVLGE
ncbi:FIST C-terminal domain-containing protein [Patescibacteria group bacterium]|nr:FIST C-terminal domain-containing protein [Patescibacteria group bacterium]MBU4481755.1 FIST C-terminal domain-containing protein [Patescibacteria group bacterium]